MKANVDWLVIFCFKMFGDISWSSDRFSKPARRCDILCAYFARSEFWACVDNFAHRSKGENTNVDAVSSTVGHLIDAPLTLVHVRVITSCRKMTHVQLLTMPLSQMKCVTSAAVIAIGSQHQTLDKKVCLFTSPDGWPSRQWDAMSDDVCIGIYPSWALLHEIFFLYTDTFGSQFPNRYVFCNKGNYIVHGRFQTYKEPGCVSISNTMSYHKP